MDNFSEWISEKLVEFDEVNEVAKYLDLICEHPKIQFVTFQFIYSRPARYAIPFVKTTYPIEWVNHYLQHNFMDSDPIVRHSLHTDKPFLWSEVKVSRAESLMMQQAISFGLSPIGYSVPTIDVGPYRGLLSINASTNEGIDWATEVIEAKKLWIATALEVHKMAREEVDPDNEYVHELSKREMECLRLIADGKSHSEIANILGISEHTVRGYFRTLRLKLNCTTLAQAVGKAKELKLL